MIPGLNQEFDLSLHVFFVSARVFPRSSGFSGFLPQHANMHIRVTDDSEFAIDIVCVYFVRSLMDQ